jgi:serine phosphatase RsbU (regulator of sigma subunit)
MTEQGQVIGLPRDEQFADPVARRSAILREASELGVQMVQDGTRAYMELHVDDREAYRFVSDGRNWWAGAAPFTLGPNRSLLMAVAVPADDLLEQVERLRWTIIAVTVLVLAGALWRAAVLAHRYSEPIEALVRQSDRISRGDLEPGPAITSRVREVRRLARAQERMRLGLRSLVKLERDLQLARQIQERTFPDAIPKLRGFRIDAWSEPAEETGGDTYDVVQRGDRVVLLLADATGHGIGPAISVTQVRSMLRMAVQLGADLATIVRDLNKQLCADLPDGRFITAWLGEIDTAAGTLTSFSAGQAPIVRYDAAGGTCEALPADAVPLGVVVDLPVEIAGRLELAVGDIVAVISDGIYEALNDTGKQFGVDRVTRIIVDHHDETPAEIIAALREAVDLFTGEVAANDDRTGIVIKKTR